MAYIGKVSIRDNSHMENAIGYISREEKALSIKEFKEALSERLNHLQEVNADFGERMTCINCSANTSISKKKNFTRNLISSRQIKNNTKKAEEWKDKNVYYLNNT